MDATEKVLNNLIDAMHKHIAKGNGNKKVDSSKELEKAMEIEPEEKREDEQPKKSIFDKFLESELTRRPKPKSVEMTVSSKKVTKPQDKKKK